MKTIKKTVLVVVVLISLALLSANISATTQQASVNGSASYADNLSSTNSTGDDFREESIYFLMTDRFVNVNSSNDYSGRDDFGENIGYNGGDFQGIIDNLDYIKGMGFTAIWITPVVDNPDYRFNGEGIDKNKASYHGYWGMDFTKCDEHWESSGATFDELVNAVHAKDMKLVLDIVCNHASPAYTMNPELEGFGEVWENGTKIHDHGNHPTYPSAEMDDPYWFHHNGPGGDTYHDLAQLADFNTENEHVRIWLKNVYTGWQNKGADAFRIDTIMWCPHDFWKDFTAAMGTDFFMFGEAFSFDYGTVSSYTYDGMSVLDFVGYDRIKSVFRGGNYADMHGLLDNDWRYSDARYLVNFIDNHDVRRFEGTEEQLIDALNWIFTIRGIPCVYYGTEIAFNAGKGEYDGGRAYYGAENIANAPNSPVYQQIVKLTNARKKNVALQKGSMDRSNVWVSDTSNAFAFKREFEDNKVCVALNKADGWSDYRFSDVENGNWTDALSGWTIAVSDNTLNFGVSPHSVAIYVVGEAGIPKKMYLRGTFNNWSLSDLMVKNPEGEWELTKSLSAGTIEYKFDTGNWTKNENWGHGDEGTEVPQSGYAVPNAPNIVLNIPATGEYTFKFNESRRYFTVTGVGPVTTTFRVHYDAGWGNNITIRGSIPQLNNWQAPGRAGTWTEGNVWVYDTTDIPEGTEFEWKPLINDETWGVSDNYKGVGGQTMDEYPEFEKIPGVEVTPPPRPTPTQPGFEAVPLIIGLLTIAYLIRRRRY